MDTVDLWPDLSCCQDPGSEVFLLLTMEKKKTLYSFSSIRDLQYLNLAEFKYHVW